MIKLSTILEIKNISGGSLTSAAELIKDIGTNLFNAPTVDLNKYDSDINRFFKILKKYKIKISHIKTIRDHPVSYILDTKLYHLTSQELTQLSKELLNLKNG